MKSLRNILQEEYDKHNLLYKLFTYGAYENYRTDATKIQGYEDDITKEDIESGLNAVTNLYYRTMPH